MPRLRKLRIRAPGGSYPVLIGSGALGELPALLDGGERPSRLHVVTDRRVARSHGDRVERLLGRTGLPLSRTVLPPGEGSKSFAQLERILRDAVRAGADRRALLIALGGGVVGDVTGYAAASLLRGVPFIQVPTSLLAMVDASVGGKTGINLPEGKNLVGSFHQPRAVVIDLDVLATLPPREARAGWAEIIKTAAIRDESLLGLIESESAALLGGEPSLLARVVERCVRIKASVVEADEREAGLRMVLNFGHTLAHGIEAAQDYGGLLHGEAVAVGMAFAARLGEALGRTPRGTAERLERLIAAYGLPARVAHLPFERVWQAMSRDKKRGPRGLRWVLLARAGEAMIAADVPEADARRELRKFLADARTQRRRRSRA
jgi:3-dehydroquinate synthase